MLGGRVGQTVRDWRAMDGPRDQNRTAAGGRERCHQLWDPGPGENDEDDQTARGGNCASAREAEIPAERHERKSRGAGGLYGKPPGGGRQCPEQRQSQRHQCRKRVP